MGHDGYRMGLRIPQPFFLTCILLLLSFPVLGLGASGDSGTGSSSFVLKVKDNLLTLKANDIPLKEVLTEIVNQTGIHILIHGELEEVLSADFSGLPLDEGLRRLIKDSNYVFIYETGKGKGGEPPIKQVIIYSKKGGGPTERLESRVMVPEKREKHLPETLEEASLDSLVRALKDKDPGVREEAVDRLVELDDRRVIIPLTRVLLQDSAPDVRETAAEALGELGDKRAVRPLVQALRDREAGVRESAVDALAEIGGQEAINALKGALRDEDEDVREAAADALEEMTEKDFSDESVDR